ncbi:RNA-directed DNA polymerase, eukaryota [Tanacetum coccineum]|uniref:RNA-directed DNA polymerase, eukaryota n=1 Tax=Tanacetum coccineum TaxID=301880 RepID=A0ABQ5C486_9ASTR
MSGVRSFIKNELGVIDKDLNRGVVSDTNLHRRLELMRQLHDIIQMEARDSLQKSKVKWAIEGDENSKKGISPLIHGRINKKRSHLSIRGVFVDGLWNTKPGKVKDAFLKHFEASEVCRRDEIRMAVWNCGIIESPGPIVTKILANRLDLVISDLVSDTQYAFVSNRQILDGPFILNEVLNWCKRKKKQAMFFKVDFAKAYDLLSKASVMYIRSPSTELPFHCGLKQRDPLSSYLFILIMESLHMSFSRAVNEGLLKGEWSDANLKSIVNILKCFFLASRLKINIHKSQVLGVGIPRSLVVQAAASIGCAVMQSQFRYLGVMVGECMSRHKAWTDTVLKLRSRLSNWKVKTLSIGGRLTLLKSVLGASPLYNMSIYKVPRGVLKSMEAIRSKFFNGADYLDKKITWAAWDKVLAYKKNGGLDRFPRLFALEMEKEVSFAVKMGASVANSFRRFVRDGSERHQMLDMISMLESVSLSSAQDRWICDLFGDGEFRVKEGTDCLLRFVNVDLDWQDLSSFSDWHS